MSGGALDAVEQDLALAAAAGGLAGRESLAAIARDLALRLDFEQDSQAAAALARALHAVLIDLALATQGDDWEYFLQSLTNPDG